MRRALLLPAIAVLACVAGFAARGATAPRKALTFAILEDYDKGDDLTDVARDFALFRELGITTWRGSFGWDDYEPERGHFDFTWLEQFADLAAAQGITLRPYIGYTPKWAAKGGTDADDWNDPPRNPDDWTAFVRALANAMRRHSNVVSFEIYNEENVKQWWDGTPQAYNDVLRRASDAIHAADPQAHVIFGGMVFPDARWVGYACGDAHNGRRFDVLPFHAYPETWTPPDVDLEHYLGAGFAHDFVGAADRMCGRKPIWINETGFATVTGRSERDQAEWWARAVATFAAAPRVEHIGVYEIKDLKPDSESIGGTPNYHLGITYADRTKKLAFRTLQRLVPLFSHGSMTVADDELRITAEGGDAPHVYRHLFVTATGEQLAFVWTKERALVVEMWLPHRGTRALEYALDGTETAVRAFDGRTLSAVALEPGEVRMYRIIP